MGITLFSRWVEPALPAHGAGCGQVPSFLAGSSSRRLVERILLLLVLLSTELIALSFWLDGDSLVRRTGLTGIMHGWGAWIVRCMVGFAAIFVTFAYLKNKTELEKISDRLAKTPVRGSFLFAHCATMGVFLGLSFLLYGGRPFPWPDLTASIWFATGISAIVLAGLAFLPWENWVQLIRSTGYLWAYTSVAVISACAAGNFVRMLWQPASRLTFALTRLFLTPFVSGIVEKPAKMVIGTRHFTVQIAPECSGLEGVGLILAFGILWLLIFKRECRLPRSLILIPVGVAVIFLFNAARIAALILIGNAGARQIALNGFHSQAGWISFSLVSVGFCFVVQRVPWFTTRVPGREPIKSEAGIAAQNPTVAYLLPFVMILAAGMIASATTSADKFEWLYPLRFVAAGGTLWIFRNNYPKINWKLDWLAPSIGVAVFLIWIALDPASNPIADGATSATWTALPMATKVVWTTLRVLAAVTTVPLAEELAFRAFLMRRMISPDFESVSFRRLHWIPLVASATVFGVLHGGYWIAGIIAGILFGLATVRRGRIGDAIVAHATANALLAAYVLAYHKWHLW